MAKEVGLQSVLAGEAESALLKGALVGFDLVMGLQVRIQVAPEFKSLGTALERADELSDIKLQVKIRHLMDFTWVLR